MHRHFLDEPLVHHNCWRPNFAIAWHVFCFVAKLIKQFQIRHSLSANVKNKSWQVPLRLIQVLWDFDSLFYAANVVKTAWNSTQSGRGQVWGSSFPHCNICRKRISAHCVAPFSWLLTQPSFETTTNVDIVKGQPKHTTWGTKTRLTIHHVDCWQKWDKNPLAKDSS